MKWLMETSEIRGEVDSKQNVRGSLKESLEPLTELHVWAQPGLWAGRVGKGPPCSESQQKNHL